MSQHVHSDVDHGTCHCTTTGAQPNSRTAPVESRRLDDRRNAGTCCIISGTSTTKPEPVRSQLCSAQFCTVRTRLGNVRHSDHELNLKHLQKYEQEGLLELRLHDHRGVHNHPTITPVPAHPGGPRRTSARKCTTSPASIAPGGSAGNSTPAGNGLGSARARPLSPPPPPPLPPRPRFLDD